MKTNVSIELTDEERDALANVIDGKMTKRLATRADIVELVTKFIGGIKAESEHKASKATPKGMGIPATSDLYRIRSGEEALLRGKSESYIRGWNSARTDGK